MNWLIEHGTFLTQDPERPVVRGWLAVRGDRIAGLGEGEAPRDVRSAARERVEGKDLLFLPGLVNTHGHAAMTLLRGYADDLKLQEWLNNYIWPMEARLTGDDVYWGTLLAAAEMIRTGTTAFADMYFFMDRAAEAVETSGMRASLCRGIVGLGSEAEWREKVADGIRFAREWNGKADGRIRTMLGPHAPYTCPPPVLEKVVGAAHEFGLPIHIHMSETAAEVEQNVRDYGVRPAEHLDRVGVFTRPTLLAHAVHLTDEEIALLAERGAAVSHNPVSNLKLASGIARVPDLLRAGVVVTLGTDSVASNNNLDLFEEIKLTAMLHKGVTGDPTVLPAGQVLRMATVDGARVLGMEDTGMLKEGWKADLIALRTDRTHFVPRTDFVSHAVYAACGADVEHVWVDGRQLMRGRELLTLDEERIRHEVQKRFERLLRG